jgi:hypothetical protein
MCDLFFDHMPAVGTGARVAIGECQWQFKSQRWNCSAPNGNPEVLGPVLRLGTREAAFTYAIVSAGVAHQVRTHHNLTTMRLRMSAGVSRLQARPDGHVWLQYCSGAGERSRRRL